MAVNLRDGIVRLLDSADHTIATGFVVSSNGLIATCAHVFGNSIQDKVEIAFAATSERRKAIVDPKWHTSDAEDVAFFRVDGELPQGVQPLPLGSSSDAVSGEPIVTLGFPDNQKETKVGSQISGNVVGLTRPGTDPQPRQLQLTFTSGQKSLCDRIQW